MVSNGRSLFPVPPSVPVVTLEGGQQVWTMVGPYDEGDRLALTCSVQGGQ